MKDDSTYTTSDTALASWLVSQGFELQATDFNPSGSVVFLFENNSDEFSTAVKEFLTGTAVGNVPAFFRAYKQLISKVQNLRSKGNKW